MRLSDIQIRDPFLLPVRADGDYYLFGSTDADIWQAPATGFDCYRSSDLVEWEGPIPAFRPPAGFWSDRNYWAPEVHAYDGRYFLFATFKSESACRGTQVLVADRPEGPYAPWSDGPVTPSEWECLDGTLFVDRDGTPWIVFCHEWIQVGDGEVVAQRLSIDLRTTEGDPIVLFTASEAPWVRPVQHELVPQGTLAYVTDGPFVHRLPSGRLVMLWSSFGDDGYAMGIATSDAIVAPWTQHPRPLWSKDGGHGMIARDFDGRLLLALHRPNDTPHERAVFIELQETDDSVDLVA